MKNAPTQIIDEYLDRERRKCNIIIHNLAEETPTKDHERFIHSLSWNLMCQLAKNI